MRALLDEACREKNSVAVSCRFCEMALLRAEWARCRELETTSHCSPVLLRLSNAIFQAVEDCCQLSEKCPSDLGRLSMNTPECEDCAELLDTGDVRHLRVSLHLRLGQVIDAASTADECTVRKLDNRAIYGVTRGNVLS